MGTIGTFQLDLNNVRDLTNYSLQTTEKVTEGLKAQGDLIGLAIAIALALSLIIGVVLLAINFIPTLISKVKDIKNA